MNLCDLRALCGCFPLPHAIRRDPEPEAEPFVLWRVRVAEPTPCAVGVEEPAAAADHALLAARWAMRIDVRGCRLGIRPVPIGGPFPHVAVHVAEAPGVQRERS